MELVVLHSSLIFDLTHTSPLSFLSTVVVRDLQVISVNSRQTANSYLNAFLDWERINGNTGGQPRRHIPTIGGGIADIDRINSYLRSRFVTMVFCREITDIFMQGMTLGLQGNVHMTICV